MKGNKIWTILLTVALFLQVTAEALTVAVVLRLDMLPDRYVIVLIAVMLLLLLLLSLLIYVPVRGKVGKARRVTACVLALLIVVGCAVAAGMVSKAYDAVHKVTNTQAPTNVRDMYIFVRTEDGAKSLSDTKDYTFGAIEGYNQDQTEHVISRIEETVKESPKVNYYGQNTLLAEALFAGDVDALIMNGASAALLLEEEAYEDFMEKARILETISYHDPEETTKPIEGTDGNKESDITNTPFVVYISGSDTRSSKLTVSRSDVNILAVVNPVSKQVLLINTPRDYYVPNPAGKGALDKLTHCGLYGIDCSMKALEGLYGIEIQHYGQINFVGFETLVDAVGGITVYSDQSFVARETHIKKGENFLTGSQALDFARERYHVSGGDNGRGKNQMKVITAVINKLTDGNTVLANYSSILDSLKGTFKTDLQMSDISKLVKMQLNDMAKWNVQSFAVSGTGGSEKTYSAPGVNAYVMHPDMDVVAYAGELVQKVLDGEILTKEDMTYQK